jgi:hypothetical protein
MPGPRVHSGKLTGKNGGSGLGIIGVTGVVSCLNNKMHAIKTNSTKQYFIAVSIF